MSEIKRMISENRRLLVGTCAMEKKVEGKPMHALMKRLQKGDMEWVKFGDDCILNKPVEEWPKCDALIAFYSDGFPLEKAQKYVEINPKMYVLNDLEAQHWLFCRRTVYKVLKEYNIPTPTHVFCNRGEKDWPDSNFQEFEDHIVCDGEKISKPFVEKPVSGEDHNVYIYYPRSAGGGCKHLFRKVGDKSSDFFPDENNVRRNGSFIYEEFLPTEGTDVKVYAVGPEYAHAEARKSPVVDGVVNRSEDGKEIRYPVMLTRRQKKTAHDVARAFRQQVCGFDILVCGKEFYVCDVNGWSFVKNSPRFWDDSANILRELIWQGVGKKRHGSRTQSYNDISRFRGKTPSDGETYDIEDDDVDISDKMDEATLLDEGEEELRCVISVIRHGDRTPKQKMKMTIESGGACAPFLSLIKKKGTGDVVTGKEVKLKTAKELTAVLEMSRNLLQIIRGKLAALMESPGEGEEAKEKSRAKEEQLREQIGHLETMRNVLEKGGSFGGINRKVQIKPIKVEDGKVLEALLVLKWGGNLTNLGREQAAELGATFRSSAYPGESTGFLRLHNSFRHDLKIYSSDEGRVQMTAGAFTKVFLDLEGEITPILVSLVSRDNDAHSMLDPTGVNIGKELMDEIKVHLKNIMQRDENITSAEDLNVIAPAMTTAIINAIRQIENPVRRLKELHATIGALLKEISDHINKQTIIMGPSVPQGLDAGDLVELHDGETLRLMHARWMKLYKDLFSAKKGTFDISKIPDVYDCAKYDAIHNQKNLGLKSLPTLYDTSRCLSEFIAPSEYGMTRKQKLDIGVTICRNLMKKLVSDIESCLPKDQHAESDDEEQAVKLNMDYLNNDLESKQIKTRLYFTSESHIHSILNVIRYAHYADTNETERACGLFKSVLLDPKGLDLLSEIPEWDYLSRIIFRLYENKSKADHDPARFRIEILVSPGMCGDACPGGDEEYRTGKNGKPFPGLHKDRSLKQAVKLENPASLNGTLTASTFFKAIQKALDQKQLNVSETHSYGVESKLHSDMKLEVEYEPEF